MQKRLDLDYWQSIEERFAALYPDGLTGEQVDEANREMWRNAYPTLEMAEEDERQQDLLQP